jgi:elongation factor P--beta-lysine ligase
VHLNDPEYVAVLLTELSKATDFGNLKQVQAFTVRAHLHLSDHSRRQLRKAARLAGLRVSLFTSRSDLIDLITAQWLSTKKS